MQAFARGSFWEGLFWSKIFPFFAKIVLLALLEPCERLCSAKPSLRLSRLSLYDKENLIFWRRISDGFYFRHAVRTEGIKTHAVLSIDKIFVKF